MSLRDISAAQEAIQDQIDLLERIDWDFPLEPSDDAEAEAWRDYAMSVADKLADAEKAVDRAISSIKGK